MFAATEHLQLLPGFVEFLLHQSELAQEFVTFRDQRLRHRNIAGATTADQRRGRVFPRAIWADHAQGTTFRTKLVVPTRPSVSLISTRTMCSPSGSSTSGMSMPVGATKDLTRGVRSTFGVLR